MTCRPGPPPLEFINKWLEEWDVHPDAHSDAYGWVAFRAAEWGYQQCNAEYERASFDLYPPPPDFEPEDTEDPRTTTDDN